MSAHSSKCSPPGPLIQRASDLDPREIDRLYGLEPIFDPSRDEERSTLGEFVQVQCPWCGEVSGTAVDLTTNDRAWIEDCQVCCRPMQVEIELDETGAIASVSTYRDD